MAPTAAPSTSRGGCSGSRPKINPRRTARDPRLPQGHRPTTRRSLGQSGEAARQRAADEAAQRQAQQRAADEAAQRQAQQRAADEAAQRLAQQRAADEAAQRLAQQRAADEAAQRLAQQRAADEAAQRQAQQRAADEAAQRQAQQRADEAAQRLAQQRAADEAAQRLAQQRAADEAAQRQAQQRAADEAAQRLAQQRAADEAAKRQAQLPSDQPDQSQIAEAQRRLTSLGLAPGGTDGRMRPRTQEMLRAFQMAIGQPATGELTPALLEALRREAPSAAARAKSLFRLAADARQSGRTADAVRLYDAALQLAPGDSDGLLALGDLHRDRGEFDAARQSYEKLRQGSGPAAAAALDRLARLPGQQASVQATNNPTGLPGDGQQARRAGDGGSSQVAMSGVGANVAQAVAGLRRARQCTLRSTRGMAGGVAGQTTMSLSNDGGWCWVALYGTLGGLLVRSRIPRDPGARSRRAADGRSGQANPRCLPAGSGFQRG